MTIRTFFDDLADARNLMLFFSINGVAPGDTPMIMAAMHACMLRQAQDEGKPATIEGYVGLYREALNAYVPLLEQMDKDLRSNPEHDPNNDPTVN